MLKKKIAPLYFFKKCMTVRYVVLNASVHKNMCTVLGLFLKKYITGVLNKNVCPSVVGHQAHWNKVL